MEQRGDVSGHRPVAFEWIDLVTPDRFEVGGSQSLWAVVERELYLLTVTQGLETIHINGAVVDEDLALFLIVHQDKAVSFIIIEPFDYTGCHKP